jgi:hypothetical protein
MKLATVSKLALYITGNALLSTLLTMMVLIAGVLTHSLPLIIVSSVMAFGRPLLYCALFNAEQNAGKSGAMDYDRRGTFDRRSHYHPIVINRPAPWLNLRAEFVIGALTAMRLGC